MTAPLNPNAPFIDLHRLDEDTRIDLIGRSVMAAKKTVAVCIDADPVKVERYLRKLRQQFPGIVVEGQFPGPVADVVTVKLRPPNAETN